MSAAQMQQEAPEAAWPGLEALGLSRTELVLAEALQMEYDALSRLRQDKSETVHSPSGSSNPGAAAESPQPDCSTLRGLSGSSPSPSQLGGPDSPPCIPPRVPPPPEDHAKQSLLILDAWADPAKDPAGSGSRHLGPLPDETPPALPPRIPIGQPRCSESPVLLGRETPPSHNVNLFLAEEEQPKQTSGGRFGSADYDSLNEALQRLHSSQGSGGAPLGKPQSHSKTLPPRVPPRTHLHALKHPKNPQQLPAHLVRGCGGLASLTRR